MHMQQTSPLPEYVLKEGRVLSDLVLCDGFSVKHAAILWLCQEDFSEIHHEVIHRGREGGKEGVEEEQKIDPAIMEDQRLAGDEEASKEGVERRCVRMGPASGGRERLF